MKIGVFGGSFDPIHLGHINLVVQIKECKGLEKVLFCPTHISPFKMKDKPKALAKHRLEMLKIALQPLDFAEAIDLEIQDPTPSYTINTLSKLKSKFPNDELFMIAGEDVLSHFSYWKDPESILKIVKPLIGSRTLDEKCFEKLDYSYRDIFKHGYCPLKNFDISSTDIRARLAKRLYCGHLLPSKVVDYIINHKLYYNP